MQRCDPHQVAVIIAVAMASADVSGVDPAFDGTGITLDGIPRHGFFSIDRVLFANPPADPAAGTPMVIDDCFLFNNLNSL
jgi:hypothetical protein